VIKQDGPMRDGQAGQAAPQTERGTFAENSRRIKRRYIIPSGG